MTIRKLGIIGSGTVGTAVAISAATFGVAASVVLFDIDTARAEAEALDLRHGSPFLPPVVVTGGGDVGSLAGCDVMVLAAGTKQSPGQSRLELAAANTALCRNALPVALAQAPDALVLIVTNPVDVVTFVAQEIARLPAGRVFSSGTVLDTARLRVSLGEHLGVAVASVHATVAGEHGDSEFGLWSTATAGGAPLASWYPSAAVAAAHLDRLLADVRGAAGRIIAGKGATSTAIGLAAARILHVVAHDERAVLPVSTRHLVPTVGEVCLSMPAVVGRSGVHSLAPVPLNSDEQTALRGSARTIRDALDRLPEP